MANAGKFVWIGTADIKDLYIHKAKRMVPFLELLSELIAENVTIRLIHAKEPGKAFRDDFDRYPNLANGLEQILCPRTHFKCVVVDGVFAYSGSANLTGAGMGAKSEHRRNFESGIVTTEKGLVAHIMQQFDEVWMGKWCGACQRKVYCAEFNDLI
ncbi:MAG: phosphatidylserine synthase [Chitinivibrionales bacterium]|nr:phosphatidylserine synthase [Chitinivibrionales bacterium]